MVCFRRTPGRTQGLSFLTVLREPWYAGKSNLWFLHANHMLRPLKLFPGPVIVLINKGCSLNKNNLQSIIYISWVNIPQEHQNIGSNVLYIIYTVKKAYNKQDWLWDSKFYALILLTCFLQLWSLLFRRKKKSYPL